MSSLLKIIIDYPCQVYIDYEHKADASPGQLVKIPLKKGKYVLELKSSDYLLYEQEYTMQSNDEEDLIRINIDEQVKKKADEERFWKISSMDVSIKVDEEHGLYGGKGLYLVNNKTGEEYIIDCYRKDYKNYLEFVDINYSGFDECGLLKIFAELGTNTSETVYFVNKLGQVVFVKGGVHTDIQPFQNKKTTILHQWSEDRYSDYYFIDKWGNTVFENRYDMVEPFIGEKCIVVKYKDECHEEKTCGIIDCSGNVLMECIYQDITSVLPDSTNLGSLVYIVNKDGKCGILNNDLCVILNYEYESIESVLRDTKDPKSIIFIVKNGGKYGILDYNLNVIIDCVYDTISEKWNHTYFHFSKDGKKGFFDFDFKMIPIDYEPVGSWEEGLVKKDGKYGIVTIDQSSASLKFKTIIPCVYDNYKDGTGYVRNVRCFFKKDRDLGYICDEYIVDSSWGVFNDIKQINSFSGKFLSIQEVNIVNKDVILIKSEDKWGVLGITECKYDEVWCRGFFGVIWSENGKRYIGFIDETGIVSKEVDGNDIIETSFQVGHKFRVIVTVKDDGKQSRHMYGKGVVKNVYVLSESQTDPKKIELAFSCSGIASSDELDKKYMLQVRQITEGGWDNIRNYSFETKTFVE